MSRLIPLCVFLYAAFLYADLQILQAGAPELPAFIWMFVMLGYLLTPVDTTLTLCRNTNESEKFANFGEKPYEDA
jgi:hypothetical protein